VITTTHIVTNALLGRRARRLGQAGFLAKQPGWFTIGGFAPDVGLYALTAGAAIYFPRVKGMTFAESMEYAFGTLFFEDRGWIAVQNTLHSPVIVGGLLAAGKATKSPRLVAFAAGCLLHIVMDIPVHHDDGPLVLFPFNWDLRVISPVSYWDRDHYGGIVGPIDIGITVAGAAYLARQWFKNRTIWT